MGTASPACAAEPLFGLCCCCRVCCDCCDRGRSSCFCFVFVAFVPDAVITIDGVAAIAIADIAGNLLLLLLLFLLLLLLLLLSCPCYWKLGILAFYAAVGAVLFLPSSSA